MRTVSEETRITMNTRRDFVNYAHVTLHDGTELNLTPSDFRISGNSFTDDWNEGESFQLGSAIGKTATLLLDNTDGRTEEIGNGVSKVYPHGKFSEYDFYMAYFELYIHLPNSTHYQGELIDEVISIGTFTVTTPASHGATIEITGVDNMHMFDRPFDECTLNFATNPSLLTILNRCCSDCGVAIGYTDFLNSDIPVNKKPEGVTYREVVSYIAQIAGCNAVINITGALTLKYYDMSPINEILDGGRFLPWDGVDNVRDTLDGGSFEPWTGSPEDAISGGNFTDSLKYHNLTATNGTTVSTDDIHFTGVMVSYEVTNSEGNTETQAVHYPDVTDWDTYAMQIADNPFIYDGVVTRNNVDNPIPDTVARSVWDVISPLYFRVFSCQSIQDPTIEAGDCALVYDVKGNIYPTIITNVRFVTGGMTDVSCTAESPVKQNSRYVNPAAKAVAKAEKRQDDYNAMVAHFNEIANAALGYRKTEVIDPDYGTITYLHDQPRLEDSTYIVKIIGTGIFISDDGGASYNNGVDITTATMLMNLIYVHGLTADWIVAGNIDADRLKANVITSINNSTGSTTINGGKIATNSITANHIQSNAVTAAKINAGAVSADKIAAGAVNADKIAANAITSAKIATDAIQSRTYSYTSGNYSDSGMMINLANAGYIRTKNFAITSSGNAYFKGKLEAATGTISDGEGVLSMSSGDLHLNNSKSGGPGIFATKDNSAYYSCWGAVNSSARNSNSAGGYIETKTKNIVQAGIDVSDRRLKTDIEKIDAEFARDLILGIDPVRFHYKDGNSLPAELQFGVIAQEIQEVEEKHGITEENRLCYKQDDGMLSVQYKQLIAPMIKVVQMQQAEIDDLKARLERLESIVNNHE